MGKKIECVLLVDDSQSTNFYNRKLIEEAHMANKVVELESATEALEYMHQKGKFEDTATYPKPNIIFLDINMPKMDGFEFMERFEKLPKKERAHTLVVFLTTSNWNKDRVKAFNNNLIHDFIEKPLERRILKKIITYYHAKT